MLSLVLCRLGEGCLVTTEELTEVRSDDKSKFGIIVLDVRGMEET